MLFLVMSISWYCAHYVNEGYSCIHEHLNILCEKTTSNYKQILLKMYMYKSKKGIIGINFLQ